MDEEKLKIARAMNKKQMDSCLDKAEELYVMGNNEEALEKANKGFATLEPYLKSHALDESTYNNAIKNYLLRAKIQLNLKKLEHALDDANEAVRLFEKHQEFTWDNLGIDEHELYLDRGYIHKALGDFPKAIADFTKTIDQNPEHFNAYTARGICYKEQGNMQEAIKDFTFSISLYDKNNIAAYFNRGNCYYLIEDYDKMYEDFNVIVESIRFNEKVNLSRDNKKYKYYKYIPIVDYQMLSLINHDAYFSDYKTLNDPLECCLISTSAWFNYCIEQYKITPRILALTLNPESKLMYSHYAKNHTGICVEYELDLDNLSNKFSYGQVKYENGKNSIENIRDLYMLKNKEWKYEKEFRLVRFDNEEFLDVKIASITFGYKCSEDHKKIIVNLLCSIFKPDDYNEPEYYEMKQEGNSNDLKRTLFKPPDEYYLTERKLFKLMQKYNFESLFNYQAAAFSDQEHNPIIKKYLDAKKTKKNNDN